MKASQEGSLEFLLVLKVKMKLPYKTIGLLNKNSFHIFTNVIVTYCKQVFIISKWDEIMVSLPSNIQTKTLMNIYNAPGLVKNKLRTRTV